MSDSQDDDIKGEIQMLLKQINLDMNKLKNELTSVHNLIDDDASLPHNVKMVNEKLIVMAKEAGIDLENIDDEDNLDEDDILNDLEEMNDLETPVISNNDFNPTSEET